MELRWIDIQQIAIELVETHQDVDPLSLRFTDLQRWVTELQGFNDDPERGGEKILEAIQQAWIEEMD